MKKQTIRALRKLTALALALVLIMAMSTTGVMAFAVNDASAQDGVAVPAEDTGENAGEPAEPAPEEEDEADIPDEDVPQAPAGGFVEGPSVGEVIPGGEIGELEPGTGKVPGIGGGATIQPVNPGATATASTSVGLQITNTVTGEGYDTNAKFTYAVEAAATYNEITVGNSITVAANKTGVTPLTISITPSKAGVTSSQVKTYTFNVTQVTDDTGHFTCEDKWTVTVNVKYQVTGTTLKTVSIYALECSFQKNGEDVELKNISNQRGGYKYELQFDNTYTANAGSKFTTDLWTVNADQLAEWKDVLNAAWAKANHVTTSVALIGMRTVVVPDENNTVYVDPDAETVTIPYQFQYWKNTGTSEQAQFTEFRVDPSGDGIRGFFAKPNGEVSNANTDVTNLNTLLSSGEKITYQGFVIVDLAKIQFGEDGTYKLTVQVYQKKGTTLPSGDPKTNHELWEGSESEAVEVTLKYAEPQEGPYTVTYMSDSKTVVDTVTVQESESIEARSLEDDFFLGWCLYEDAATVEYEAGATITPTKDMTLYAVYMPSRDFTVHFSFDGITAEQIPENISVTYSFNGRGWNSYGTANLSKEEVFETYLSRPALCWTKRVPAGQYVDYTFTIKDADVPGYTYTVKDASGKVLNNAYDQSQEVRLSYVESAEPEAQDYTLNVTVYNHFVTSRTEPLQEQELTYTITDAEGNTVVETTTVPHDPAYPRYWTGSSCQYGETAVYESKGAISTVPVTVSLMPDTEYTITYTLTGYDDLCGNVDMITFLDEDTLVHTFTTDDASIVDGKIDAGTIETWSYDWELSFDGNGGAPVPETMYGVCASCDEGYVTNKSYNFTIPEDAPIPEKAGYIFTGWTLEKPADYGTNAAGFNTLAAKRPETGGTTPTQPKLYKNGDVVNVTRILALDPGCSTLYANWAPLPKYTVTYTDGADGKVFENQVFTVYEGSATPTFDASSYKLPIDEKASYTFYGWDKEIADTVTGNVTYTAVWQPPKPTSGSTHEALGLFTIQCDTVAEHRYVCNWFGSHVTYNNDMAYDSEHDQWTCTAKVSLSIFNLSTFDDEFGGFTHHYENSHPVISLYWDPEYTGLNSQREEVTGMWLPVGGIEQQTIHWYCYDKPAAPQTNDQIAKALSSAYLRMEDANNSKTYFKPTSTETKKLLESNALEIGQMYEENGKFYIDVKIVNFEPYVALFNEKHPSGYFIDWTLNTHTADDFTYVLTYSGKSYDYAQDGSGWSIDKLKSFNTTNKQDKEVLNGRYLYLTQGAVLTVDKSYTWTYDGETHSVTPTLSGSVADHYELWYSTDGGNTWSKNIPSITDVGKVTVTVAARDTLEDGHKTIEKSYTMEVSKKSLGTVKILGNSGTVVYNGQEQFVEGFTVTTELPEGVEVVLKEGKTARAAGTDVGTYTMSLVSGSLMLSGPKAGNYNVLTYSITKGKLTITPAPLTITVTGESDTATYDGNEHSVDGFTVTPELPEGVTVELAEDKTAHAAGTDVGEYSMGLKNDSFILTGEKAGNYEPTFNVTDGQLVISKADSNAVTGAVEVSATYDGTAHGVDAGATADGSTVTVTYKNTETGATSSEPPVNAGTYEVTVTVTNPNYEDVTATTTITIARKSLTVNVDSASKTQGQDDPEFVVTVDGVVGDEDAQVTVTRQSGEGPGTYIFTATAGNLNYEVGNVTGTFTIYAPYIPGPGSGGGTTIPDDPVPGSPDPGDGDVDIGDEDLPLAGLPLPYDDVEPDDWFYDAAYELYQSGIMTGTSSSTFSPNSLADRATAATMLYRLASKPTADGFPFPDVTAGKWYTEAVAWAAQDKVVKGYSDGLFHPNDHITREQLATMLYRYAQSMGYDISGHADLSVFTDADEISGYALPAIQWAIDNGLLLGRGNGVLDPTDAATRAEVATVFFRFTSRYISKPDTVVE